MRHIALSRVLPVALLIALPAPTAGAAEADFYPATVSELDAIACRLDAPSYTGFALAVSGDDGIAAQRHWHRIEGGNPFLAEYALPAPITVAGLATSRIAFSASGIVAILDLPDPAVVAGPEGVANAADAEPLIAAIVAAGKATRAEIEGELPFRKFLGERVVSDTVALPTRDESFGTHTRIARTIANATTHPGKTLYGCSYRIELIDRDGKPL